jgi:hypothetical protein
MKMELVIEFPHMHMDQRPTKRACLGWDALSHVPKAKGMTFPLLSLRTSSFSPETTLVTSSGLCDLIPSESPVEIPLCEDRTGGGLSLVKSVPLFVFPPWPTVKTPSPATLVDPPASTGLLSGTELSDPSVPSHSGASELGKKVRSFPSP